MFADITIKHYVEAPPEVQATIVKWLNNEYISQSEYQRVVHHCGFVQTLSETAEELRRLGSKAKAGSLEIGEPVRQEKIFRSRRIW